MEDFYRYLTAASFVCLLFSGLVGCGPLLGASTITLFCLGVRYMSTH